MSMYSDEYVDRLLARPDYSALVELQGMLWGGSLTDKQADAYGLPRALFIFVEVLSWFAQSIRSGAWTYFEATRPERQKLLLEALNSVNSEYGRRYQYGMEHWRDVPAMKELDFWIEQADEACQVWLRHLLKEHRSELTLFHA